MFNASRFVKYSRHMDNDNPDNKPAVLHLSYFSKLTNQKRLSAVVNHQLKRLVTDAVEMQEEQSRIALKLT